MCFKMFPQITSMQEHLLMLAVFVWFDAIFFAVVCRPNNLLLYGPLSLCKLHCTLTGGHQRLKLILLLGGGRFNFI